MVTYTDRTLVEGVEVTEEPAYGRTATGYGSKLPMPYRVRYAGRWRRVYAMGYSNAASVYLVNKGQVLFLDLDTEHDLEDASC